MTGNKGSMMEMVVAMTTTEEGDGRWDGDQVSEGIGGT